MGQPSLKSINENHSIHPFWIIVTTQKSKLKTSCKLPRFLAANPRFIDLCNIYNIHLIVTSVMCCYLAIVKYHLLKWFDQVIYNNRFTLYTLNWIWLPTLSFSIRHFLLGMLQSQYQKQENKKTEHSCFSKGKTCCHLPFTRKALYEVSCFSLSPEVIWRRYWF